MEYKVPEIEIVKIMIQDVMIESGGQGTGGSTSFSIERNILGVDE